MLLFELLLLLFENVIIINYDLKFETIAFQAFIDFFARALQIEYKDQGIISQVRIRIVCV